MFPLHPINSYVYVNSKDIIGRQNLSFYICWSFQTVIPTNTIEKSFSAYLKHLKHSI